MKNENTIFQKIKSFFASIFGKKKLLDEGNREKMESMDSNSDENKAKEEKRKEKSFFEVEEEKKIMELQKLFINGKIKEEDMTQEQISSLEKLFDSQIESAKRTNFNMKRKILKALLNDKETMELLRKFQNGEIKEEQMTKEQVTRIRFLYDMEIEKTKNDI